MRVLFMQPSMQPPGGGNGVAAWMVQALKDEHDVTLFTWVPVDLDRINRFWGTSLRPGDVRLMGVPAALRRAIDRLPLPLSMLRTSIMLNMVKRRVADYDVPVSANNEADFGAVGVQYIHYPWNMFPRPPVDLRWYHAPLLLPAYYKLCVGISGFSPDAMRRNVTLVNSDWTGRLAFQRYRIVSRTVYPPVTSRFPAVAWEAREPGFACVGRISPEKDLDRVIDVVTGVRAEVPGVRLHIVGTAGPARYHRRIVARARRLGWVSVHEDLARADLVTLLARQRYGIHGMREEHFGMAPAEMVRAGCLVWVPDAGGQVEIVGDARLTYGSVEDGVQKIVRVLRDPAEQDALRAHLAGRAAALSTERFMRDVRTAVADALGAAVVH